MLWISWLAYELGLCSMEVVSRLYGIPNYNSVNSGRSLSVLPWGVESWNLYWRMDSPVLIWKIDIQQNSINPICTGLDMRNCRIFWIIVWYLYWAKFLQVIFCSCSITWPVQLIREVFCLDISFISSTRLSGFQNYKTSD